MMCARTHKQSDICALWAPAISGGLDRPRLLPMMRYWLVEKCQCWITARSCEGIGENGSRFSRRPLGEAVSVLFAREALWELDCRTYGPHYWRATTSCSQRNRCFSQSRSPRGLGWCDRRLVCDFFQLCFWTVIYLGEEKTGQSWEQTCSGHTPCRRNRNGGNERELLFSSTYVSKKPTGALSPSFECVCLIQLLNVRRDKQEFQAWGW